MNFLFPSVLFFFKCVFGFQVHTTKPKKKFCNSCPAYWSFVLSLCLRKMGFYMFVFISIIGNLFSLQSFFYFSAFHFPRKNYNLFVFCLIQSYQMMLVDHLNLYTFIFKLLAVICYLNFDGFNFSCFLFDQSRLNDIAILSSWPESLFFLNLLTFSLHLSVFM